MKLGSNVGVLRVGSTAVAAVKRGTDRVYDADVAAFQKASDAADVTGIMDLVDYLKGQSLWDYARLYPMKSSQNAGSGSTVYGLGGLTTNNMTLVNSPTWGSDGVTFTSAGVQAGTIQDFLGSAALAVFWRGTNSTANSPCLCQYDFGAAKRAFSLTRSSTSVIDMRRSATGIVTETYISETLFPSVDATLSAVWVPGEPPTLWSGVTPESTSLSSEAVTQRLDTNIPVSVMAFLCDGVPAAGYAASGTVVLAGFIETAITTTQRETITDLINAL